VKVPVLPRKYGYNIEPFTYGVIATVSTKISVSAYPKGREVQLPLFTYSHLPTLLGLDFIRQERICLDCFDRTWWSNQRPDYRSLMTLHDMDYPNSDPSVVSCGVINPSPDEREITDRTIAESLELTRVVPGLASKTSHKKRQETSLCLVSLSCLLGYRILHQLFCWLIVILGQSPP
jgi:hypothetical protein